MVSPSAEPFLGSEVGDGPALDDNLQPRLVTVFEVDGQPVGGREARGGAPFGGRERGAHVVQQRFVMSRMGGKFVPSAFAPVAMITDCPAINRGVDATVPIVPGLVSEIVVP